MLVTTRNRLKLTVSSRWTADRELTVEMSKKAMTEMEDEYAVNRIVGATVPKATEIQVTRKENGSDKHAQELAQLGKRYID
jgi:hypothetical protein